MLWVKLAKLLKLGLLVVGGVDAGEAEVARVGGGVVAPGYVQIN